MCLIAQPRRGRNSLYSVQKYHHGSPSGGASKIHPLSRSLGGSRLSTAVTSIQKIMGIDIM